MTQELTAEEPGSEQILRRRAAALAQVPPAEAPQDGMALLQFRLADVTYAVEQRLVAAVHPLRQLTPLPCTPPHVRGIAAVRGRLLPVVDLRLLLALPGPGLTDLHRIIEVHVAGMQFGVLADLGVEAVSVPRALLQRALPTFALPPEYLLGVTAAGLVALDLERIAADPRLVVDEQVPDNETTGSSA